MKKKKKDGNRLCGPTNVREYNFNKFTGILLLFYFIIGVYYDILPGKVTIRQGKEEQNEINEEISDLEKYNPTNQSKIKKSKVLENARNFFDGRKKIMEAFEEGICSMSKEVLHKNQIEKQAEKQAEEKEKKR